VFGFSFYSLLFLRAKGLIKNKTISFIQISKKFFENRTNENEDW
jgi:hypothetical protein